MPNLENYQLTRVEQNYLALTIGDIWSYKGSIGLQGVSQVISYYVIISNWYLSIFNFTRDMGSTHLREFPGVRILLWNDAKRITRQKY